MSNIKNNTILSTTIGTLMASALSVSVAQADANPFAATELSSGYMVVAEGSCGEGKCGGDMMKKQTKSVEGSCGENKRANEMKNNGKKAEGNCGGNKRAEEMKNKAKNAEGKCGAKDKVSNKTSEGACGEGKCGEGKCGGKS